MPMNKKKVLELAKGFRGRAKNCIRIARERVEKALQYQYESRREKKRHIRKLWITKINAGTREYNLTYGRFIHGLTQSNIWLNRKMLSDLAANEPYSFKALVNHVKYMRGMIWTFSFVLYIFILIYFYIKSFITVMWIKILSPPKKRWCLSLKIWFTTLKSNIIFKLAKNYINQLKTCQSLKLK